jgi:hypothetical protein
MLFDLWVLCLIATGFGMFLVSVVHDALAALRAWLHRIHVGGAIAPHGEH